MKKYFNIFCFIFVAFALSLCGCFVEFSSINANAFTSSNQTSSYVTTISELWNSSSTSFNISNVNTLLKAVSGNNNSSITNMTYVNNAASSVKTAYDIKYHSTGKTSGRDLIVYLGGLTWTPVYLSKDISGNSILTLWLSNSYQLSGRTYYRASGYSLYADSFDSYGHCYRGDEGNGSETDAYPQNMYGTSMMRAVILNNGGYYAYTGSSLYGYSNFGQSSYSIFAPYTITTSNKTAIADFIVSPNQLSWQRAGQGPTREYGSSGQMERYNNEDLQTYRSNSGYYSSSYNYSSKGNYDAWGTDKLWLPSYYECNDYNIAYSSTYYGLWRTSAEQRTNTTGRTSGSSGAWTRSSNGHNGSMYFLAGVDWATSNTEDEYAVCRPALHLNLTDIANSYQLGSVDSISSVDWNPYKTPNPTITVRNKAGKALTRNTDYTVSSSSTSAPGTVTLTITGTGNYTGSLTKTYTLNKRNIAVALRDNSLAIDSLVYTGSALQPNLKNTMRDYGYETASSTSKLNSTGTALTKGTHYTLSYSNNTNKGTATVTITGTGNYTGSTTTSFVITARNISDGTYNLSKTSADYNFGYNFYSDVTPTLVVNSKTLTKGTDYDFTIISNATTTTSVVNVGSYTCRVTGKGNYAGQLDKTFTINQIDILEDYVTISPTSYEFKNAQIIPTYTVKNGSYTFDSAKDYTASYGVNKDVSTGGSVTLTGKGNFKGSATLTFAITPRDISQNYITLAVDNQVYTGANITPVPTVTDTGLSNLNLVNSSDFTLAYSTENINVGVVTITATGTGNYTNSKTVTFQIIPKDISLVTISGIANQTYTGSEIKPDLVVNDGALALATPKDYTAVYSNNINVAGENSAKVVITGKGNYTGTNESYFTISPASVNSVNIRLNKESSVYEYETNFYPSIKSGAVLSFNGNDLVLDTDYTVSAYNSDRNSVETIHNVGIYSIRFTGKGNYTSTKDVNFEITQKSLSGDDITIEVVNEDYVYNGSKIEANFKVYGSYIKDSTTQRHELEKNTEYTFTYNNNINASKLAEIVITGIGNFRNSKTKYFEITPKLISGQEIVLLDALPDVVFKAEAYTPSISVYDNILNKNLASGNDYNVVYKNNINYGTATVTITGIKNYTSSKDFSFQISQRELSLANIATIKDYVYSGSEIEPDIIVTDLGKTLVRNKDYSVTFRNNLDVTTSGGATVILDGMGNYTGKNTAAFTITPADLSSAVITITPSSAVYTGSVIVTSISVRVSNKSVASANYDIQVLFNNVETENGLLDIKNAGVYTIRAIGKKNYEGTTQNLFEVTAFDISRANATLNENNFTYNKETQTPKETITYNGIKLNDGNADDYSIVYRKSSVSGQEEANPTNSGKYFVVVTGKGNYKGTNTSLSFDIAPISLSTTNITFSEDINSADYTFDNANHKILLNSVEKDGKEYYKNSDTLYIVISYVRDNKETFDFSSAGVINLKVISANENISGEMSFPYEIKKKSLKDADDSKYLDVSTLNNLVYNRQPQTQNVTIRDREANNYRLQESDYFVSYSSDVTNVGTVTVYINSALAGNYKDSITRSYNITPAQVNSFSLNETRSKYTAKPQTILATVRVENIDDSEDYIELLQSEYRLVYERMISGSLQPSTDLTNSGEIYVSLNLTSSNFELASNITKQIYEIETVKIKEINLAISEVTYDGGDYSVNIKSVTSEEGTVLVNGTDYDITCLDKNSNPVSDITKLKNAGTYTITCTGKYNAEGVVSAVYTINPRVLTSGVVTYYETNQDLTFKTTADGNRIEIKLETDYRGQYVLPVVAVILRGQTTPIELVYSKANTLNPVGDYTFGVYSPEDENCETNLLGGDHYLSVGEYNFVISGINNYTGTIAKVYKVNLANFNKSNIDIEFLVDKMFSGSAITYVFAQNEGEDAEVKVYYDQNNDDSRDQELIVHRDFERYSGYMKIAVNDRNEITNAEIATETQYNNFINGNLDNLPTNETVLRVNDGYVNNTSFGTGTLVLTGKDGSVFKTGSLVTAKFDISQVELTDDKLTWSGYSNQYVYSAKEVISNLSSIKVKVKYKASLTLEVTADLEYGVDYELSLSDYVNVGTVTATITGINAYKGTVEKELFSITPKEISTSMFTISPDVTYSKGVSQEPIIVASYNNVEMVKDKDYTITYKRNNEITNNFISAGIITIEFGGIGNFKNASTVVSKNFTIKQQLISEITLSTQTTTFNGFNQAPEVTVRDVLGNVIDNDEYYLTYSRSGDINEIFTNAGSITIVVNTNTTSNYTLNGKRVVATYKIDKAPLSSATGEIANQKFTGTAIVLSNTFELTLGEANEYVIDKETEYSVFEYRNNINASTATNKAIVVLNAEEKNFTGKKEIEFTILPKNITEEDVIVGNYDRELVYTRSNLVPTFNITYRVNRLILNQDYNVKITRVGSVEDENNNIDVGTFNVTISGKGNYIGEKSLPFAIVERDISQCILNVIIQNESDGFVYTGSEIKPVITKISVTFNGTELELFESDYTLSYNNNIDALQDANISVTGKGNFTGSNKKDFTIKRKSLTDSDISLSIKDKSYSGNPISLVHSDLTFVYNTYSFKESDYEISYLQNPVNVGSCLVSIAGVGNFEGTIEKYFKITPISLVDAQITFNSDVFNINEITYTGRNLKQTLLDNIIVNIKGVIVNDYDYDVIFEGEQDNPRYLIDVGIKNFKLVQRNKNIVGETSKSFTIVVKNLESSMLNVPKQTFVYNGSEIKPNYTLIFNEISLIEGKDYEIVYNNNIDACPGLESASFRIIAKEDGNFRGNITYSFSIEKATPTIKLKENKTFYYGDVITEEYFYENCIDCSTQGRLFFVPSGNIELSETGKYTIKYRFIPTETHNYNNLEGKDAVIEIYAIYKIQITFDNTQDLIAGENTKVNVVVKILMDNKEDLIVNSSSYKVVITLLDNNKVVNNFALAGRYQVKVILNYPEDIYEIQGDSQVEFYVKSKILYAENTSFYAISDDYFEEGIKLVVDTYIRKNEIIVAIGNANYESVGNIVKVYKVFFYKNDVKLEGEELEKFKDVKVYYDVNTNNEFFTLDDDENLKSVQYSNGRIPVEVNTFLIEREKDNSTIILIIGIVVGVILLIILLIIIIKLIKNKKNKKANKITISMNEFNSIANSSRSTNPNAQNNMQNQNLQANNPQQNIQNMQGANFANNPNIQNFGQQNINPNMMNSTPIIESASQKAIKRGKPTQNNSMYSNNINNTQNNQNPNNMPPKN